MDLSEQVCRELLDGLHEVKRELAVVGERLANDRDNRELFTVQYERRHAELQTEQADVRKRLDTAERERSTLNTAIEVLQGDTQKMRVDLNAIAANIRWVVYLILGLIITAVVGLAIGGAAGHVRVN